MTIEKNIQPIFVNVDVYVADNIEKYLSGILPDVYATQMKHYLGTVFPSCTTEDGFHVTDFRIKMNGRHDIELWAVIDNKAYKHWVDGESELGHSIKRMGSYHMPIDEKMKLLRIYLLPKAIRNKG